jgi:hypothetical protein
MISPFGAGPLAASVQPAAQGWLVRFGRNDTPNGGEIRRGMAYKPARGLTTCEYAYSEVKSTIPFLY